MTQKRKTKKGLEDTDKKELVNASSFLSVLLIIILYNINYYIISVLPYIYYIFHCAVPNSFFIDLAVSFTSLTAFITPSPMFLKAVESISFILFN